MNFKGTVERLMNLIEVQDELFNKVGTITQLTALDRLIAAQIDRVKINVMTYALDSLDFFNAREWTPETARQQKGGTYGS